MIKSRCKYLLFIILMRTSLLRPISLYQVVISTYFVP